MQLVAAIIVREKHEKKLNCELCGSYCFVHYFNCKYLFLDWKFKSLFCWSWDYS